MIDTAKHDAIAHARTAFPRESCGLLVNISGIEQYFACRNIATHQDDFVMHPEDYARAEDLGEIMAVVHSHPNAPANPSQADLVACEASGLPWYIVSLPSEFWNRIEPTGYKAPYTGRKFAHGVLDCFSLIRDWYAGEMKIELEDYDREVEWWAHGGNLYLENFRQAGFDIVTDGSLRRGDVILMQIRSKVTNHAAIYLGDDKILHHLLGRLSSREVYGGYWAKATTLVVRHRSVK